MIATHDLRGFVPRRPTPSFRFTYEPFKPTRDNVRAYVDTPTLQANNLRFDSRAALLTFVRAACDGEPFVNGRIYGGGYDSKGEFLVVGQAITRNHYGLVRGTGRTKVVIEEC